MSFSLRSRLVLSFATLTTLVVVAASFVIYASMSAQLTDVVDAALKDRALDTGHSVRDGDFDISGDGRLVQVLDLDGSTVASSPAVPDEAVMLHADPQEVQDSGFVQETIHVTGLDHRIRVRAEAVDSPEGPVVVIVARSLAAVDENREQIKIGLALSTPLMAVIIGLLGWILARRILAPVAAMGRRAAALSPYEERIDVGLTVGQDEFSELAGAFNSLLDRLSDVRSHEQQFIANVSHELRTPLAIVRGELELIALDVADTSDQGRGLRSAIDEVDRMTNLVGRLLMLARAEAGAMPLAASTTDLKALIDGLVARMTEVSLGTIPVDTSGVPTLVANVDAELLSQVVTNLLTNAVRHAASHVFISLEFDGQFVELRVSDDGDGFSPVALETALTRFSQGEPSRRAPSGDPRFGLGLAIVMALASTGGGDVRVSNDGPDGGGSVLVRLATAAT